MVSEMDFDGEGVCGCDGLDVRFVDRVEIFGRGDLGLVGVGESEL